MSKQTSHSSHQRINPDALTFLPKKTSLLQVAYILRAQRTLEAQRYVEQLNRDGFTEWRLSVVQKSYDLNYHSGSLPRSKVSIRLLSRRSPDAEERIINRLMATDRASAG